MTRLSTPMVALHGALRLHLRGILLSAALVLLTNPVMIARPVLPAYGLSSRATSQRVPVAQSPPRERASIETTAGNFEIELRRETSPRTVENFVQLARRGYYNGTPLFRVVQDSLLFFGDPTGTGAGGESIYGRSFPDEAAGIPAGTYPRGAVAMANPGIPNSNTSLFFITVREARLDSRHTLFGVVVGGHRVLEALAASQLEPRFAPGDGVPLTAVTITRITIRTQ